MGQSVVSLRVVLQPPATRGRFNDYSSGSVIDGHLVAEIAAPVSVERVSLYFSGRGNVNCTGKGIRFHGGQETYCNDTHILAGQAEQGVGPAEHLSTVAEKGHSFPFRVTIPSSAPSSHQSSKGSIRYELQGDVKMSDRTHCKSEPVSGQAEQGVGPAEHLSLPAGAHSFPFRVTIPSSAPSSHQSSKGSIRYELQGDVRMSDRTHCKSEPAAVSVSVYHPVNTADGHLVAEIAAPVSVERAVERVSQYFSGRGNVNCTGEGNRFHGGQEAYCNDTHILAGQAEQGVGPAEHLQLPAGAHSFPFRVTIPSSAPSSHQSSKGSIRYELQGDVRMSDRTHCKSEPVSVSVYHPVNIAEEHLLQPKRQEVQNTFSSFPLSSYSLSLVVTVPKTGYCIGEEIAFSVSFENGSRHSICLTASVDELIVYTSQDSTPVVNSSKQTIVSVKSHPMKSKSTHEWNSTLEIPMFPVEDTHTSQIIQLSYSLTVTAVVSQSHSDRNLSTSIPLKIGRCEQPKDKYPILSESADMQKPTLDTCTPQLEKGTTTSDAKCPPPFTSTPPSPSAPSLSPSDLPSYEEALAQHVHRPIPKFCFV